MTSSRFWWPRRTTRQQELPNGGIITSSGPSLPYTSISNSNSSINDEKNIDREPILSSSPWSYSGITSAPSVSYYDSYLSWSMSKWKRKILTILHFVILALACLGCYDLIQFNKGYYMKTPVYSKYQLSQAGYLRREQQQYSQYGSTKNLPPSLEEGYSSITSNHGNGQDERPLSSSSSSSSSYRTPVTSWTFPSFFQNEANPASSSSLGLVAGAHHTNSHNSSSTHISATISPSVTSNKASDQHLLILSPIRNAAHLLPTFFNNLEKLTHPKMNTSIGILLSDEEDETGSIVQDWVNLQSIKNEYRHITLLRKDFGLIMPSGKARHEDWVQTQRRSIMARARSLLLVSTLEPSVDWVFWLDVDVKEIPSTIIADLLRYGGVGAETRENDKNNLVSSSPTTSQYTTPSIVSGQEGQEEVDGKDSDQITTETQDNLDGSIKGDHNDDIVDHSIMKRGTYSKKEKKSKTKTKNQNQRQKQISNHDMSHVPADVIAPNIMNRHKGRVQPYDRSKLSYPASSIPFQHAFFAFVTTQ